MEHQEGDFDIDANMTRIFFYATVILLRLQTLYPEPPVVILAQPVQDRKERLVIRAGFYPQGPFGDGYG